MRSSRYTVLIFLIQNSTFSLMVVFQKLIIYSDFLEIIKCFKNSWFICGNISHHHSEFRWHKISLEVCVNNMPLHIFNWISIVTIMLIILYAFFFTSHTKSKKKKKKCTYDLKINEYTCDLQCTCGFAEHHIHCHWTMCMYVYLPLSPYPLPLGHVYIFLFHHIHCHCAVANSFSKTSVASQIKYLAFIIPN